MTIRIALLAAATLAALAQPALAAQNVTKRAAVAADVRVRVKNVQGRVHVAAWDRKEIELVAVLESDRDRLEFEASEGMVRVEVTRPERDDSEKAMLTLHVPMGARLDVSTVSADIKVTGVRGEQELGTVSGTLETQAHDEALDVRSVSGDITVAGSGGKAAVRSRNVNGTTTVTALGGSYEGETVSGELHATVEAVSRLRLASVTGDIEVSGGLAPNARVDVKSTKGAIGLRIRPPVDAELEMESLSGGIESCFGGKASAKGTHGPGRELRTTQGSGSSRVRLKTLSGEIRVCDR